MSSDLEAVCSTPPSRSLETEFLLSLFAQVFLIFKLGQVDLDEWLAIQEFTINQAPNASLSFPLRQHAIFFVVKDFTMLHSKENYRKTKWMCKKRGRTKQQGKMKAPIKT